jgi:tetratricopeptide (TPR) repeat protein
MAATSKLSNLLKWLLLLVALLIPINLLATPSLSSSQGHSPDSVKISSTPCKSAWGSLPKQYKKKVGVGGLTIDPKKVFMTKCNQYKDRLIASVKKPISNLQKQAQGAVDAAKKEAQNTFLSWVAEKFKDQIMPTLPPDVRAKYDSNSPLIQAHAQQWLNQPGREVSTYVNEYIKQKAPTIAKGIAIYTDLTQGQSAEILKDLKGVLSKARKRLGALLKATAEIEKNPDVPYTKILQKYGLSGEYVDRFKGYEGRIRAFNKAYNAKEIVMTTIDAFQTNDPKMKISKMFDLMDSMSAVAQDSKIPMVALVGDIVNAMAKAAKQMLEATLNLGKVLEKRAGYCKGVSTPGISTRSDILKKRGIFACPLSETTMPWKHIYETIEPVQGKILFWDGNRFIDGIDEGGHKAGVQAAIKLMTGARALGYPVKPTDVGTIAKVYNTPGGIPKLMKEANKVINEIALKANQLKRAMGTKGKCSRQDIIKQVESMTGLNLSEFLNELDTQGRSRLVTTYAASYVAKTGGFGDSSGKRSGAYDRYRKIYEKIKDVELVILDGRVRNRNNPNGACKKCAKAIVDAKVSGGQEVRGCEVWQADSRGNFVLHIVATTKSVSVTIKAMAAKAQSPTRTLTLVSGVNSVRLLLDIKDDDEDDENKDCDKVADLLKKARGLLNQGQKEQASQLMEQTRHYECEKLKPDIDALEDDINKSKEIDLTSCDIQKIKTHLENPDLKAEIKQKLTSRLKLLEKANVLIETKISSKEQLKKVISDIEAILNKVTLCSSLVTRLQDSLKMLKDLQKALKQKVNCDLKQIDKLIKHLEKFNQPVTKSRISELVEKKTKIKQSDSEYELAKAPFKKGDAAKTLIHLQKAKTLISNYQCFIRDKKINDAIAKVNDMQKAQNNPEKALESCNLAIINSVLIQIKDKPELSNVKQKLLNVKKAISDYRKARTFYRQGLLDKSESLLRKARAKLLGVCPNLNERIDNGLKKIARLRKIRARILDAIKTCDIEMLHAAQNKLTKKVNPYLKPLLPLVKKALLRCAKVAAQEKCKKDHGIHVEARLSNGNYVCVCKQGFYLNPDNNQCAKPKTKEEVLQDGHPRCRKEYGVGAYAVRKNPDGSYHCQCRVGYRWRESPKGCVKQTVKDGHSQCKKEFGSDAYAIKKNPDGSFQCQCKRGYRWNKGQTRCINMSIRDGHGQCKRHFGRGAYAVKINSDGTYQCQCKRRYRWNSGKTKCIRMRARDGHNQCKREFGRGAYSVRANADGSYQCQCKRSYRWNRSQTRCIRVTKRDGHRECRRHYGRGSYAIRYLGNGRWECFDPRRARCPAGYYRSYQGICLPKAKPRGRGGCPPGYHKRPGGGCHKGRN